MGVPAVIIVLTGVSLHLLLLLLVRLSLSRLLCTGGNARRCMAYGRVRQQQGKNETLIVPAINRSKHVNPSLGRSATNMKCCELAAL